jgi:hypothetical protein
MQCLEFSIHVHISDRYIAAGCQPSYHLRKRGGFECFPYVCPESILVK